MDDGNEPVLGDDADAPIFLPSPGSILRRTARTKIRKASLAGDGGGHRFAATRKGRTTAAPQYDMYDEDDDPRNRSLGSDESEERSGEDAGGVFASSAESHDDVEDSREEYYDAREGEAGWERRPSDSSVDEGMIFDAYASRGDTSRSSSISSTGESRDTSPDPSESDHHYPTGSSSLPSLGKIETSFDWPQSDPQDEQRTPTQESVLDPLRHGVATMTVSPQPTSPKSPTSPSTSMSAQQTPQLPPGMAPPLTTSVPPGIGQRSNSHPISLTSPTSERPKIERSGSALPSREKEKEKEKEKRGGLFSRSGKKDKEKEVKSKKTTSKSGSDKKEKEKDGFLGSLFGGKKKQEESPVANFSAAGPAAAAALLGSSKSAKSLGLIPMNGQAHSPTSPGFSNFARYPIHVERAVYRLSHIKLANPRRPLYEQVLISNLMFWYLSVINRTQTPEEKKAPPPVAAAVDMADKEAAEAKKAQAQPKAAPAPATVPEPAPPSQKRTGLVKPERSRTKPAASVKPPEYGMQNVQVNKEIQQRVISGGGPPRSVPNGAPSPSPQQRQMSDKAISPPPLQAPPSPSSRARSPPQPQLNHPPRPAPAPQPSANINHRELQGPPRAPPASSYGPPPPMAGAPHQVSEGPRHASPGPGHAPQRRPLDDQEPLPPHAPPPSQGLGRRVAEGGPSAGYAHSGPQPGQVFQYPSQGGVQPGQVFPGQLYAPQSGPQYRPPQPGQVFHHPQYNGPPRPGPPGARPPNGPPPGWDGQQRLPPGAVQREHPDGSHVPQRRVASAESYDPRRPHPGNIVTGGYAPQYAGAPSPTRSEGGGYYQSQRPGAAQGEPFNPYTRPPPGGPVPGQQVRRQVSSDDGHSQRYARGPPVGAYPGPR